MDIRPRTGFVTRMIVLTLLSLFLFAYPATAGEIYKNMRAEDWVKRGIVFDEMGTSHAAIRSYTQAIKLYPGYADAYFYRGISYFELEEYRPAIRDFSRAIQLNPGEAAYLFNRGMAYGKCEEYHLAMVDLNQAITINRQHAAAYFWLGLLQSMNGSVKTGMDNMKISASLGYGRAQTYLQSRFMKWN